MGFRIPHVTAFHRAYRAARTPLNGHRLAPFLPAASLAEEHQNHSRVGKRWHVGHSHDHHHHHAGKGPEAEGIFRLGLAADVALATGKAFTGYISGSTAIVADAAHSVSDIVRHGKFETLGALGISSMLLATAGGIAWHAVDLLQGLLASTTDMVNHTWEHSHHNHSGGGHHHGIDLEHPILALSGAIMGVPYFDPLAGLVVSGMILKAGLETGYQSVLELVDAAVPPSVLMPIKQTITEVEGVKVDPFLSVSAAHDIENVSRTCNIPLNARKGVTPDHSQMYTSSAILHSFFLHIAYVTAL
ncbi:Metal tolerance protein 2 [Cocos nucifera]|uniref:Metal tolerance protein 2 n=1 Tax=Cocos nucifera TaxID=13894 RepID=A0A8K0IYA1_COCNU|nr:Metal tolerance protein 2 [Cocos nucifera]